MFAGPGTERLPEPGIVSAGCNRSAWTLEPPAIGERSGVEVVETKFPVEPRHNLLGRCVVSGDRQRLAP